MTSNFNKISISRITADLQSNASELAPDELEASESFLNDWDDQYSECADGLISESDAYDISCDETGSEFFSEKYAYNHDAAVFLHQTIAQQIKSYFPEIPLLPEEEIGNVETKIETSRSSYDEQNLIQKFKQLRQDQAALHEQRDQFRGYFAWASEVASGTTYFKQVDRALSNLQKSLEQAEADIKVKHFETAARQLKISQTLVECLRLLLRLGARDLESGAQDMALATRGVATLCVFAEAVLLTRGAAAASLIGGSSEALLYSLAMHTGGALALGLAGSLDSPTQTSEVPLVHRNGMVLSRPSKAASQRVNLEELSPTKLQLIAQAQQALRDYRDHGKARNVNYAEFTIAAELADDSRFGSTMYAGYKQAWEEKQARFFEVAANQSDSHSAVLALRQEYIGEDNKIGYRAGVARFTNYLNGEWIDCIGQAVPLSAVSLTVIKKLPQPLGFGFRMYEGHIAFVVYNAETNAVWDVFYDKDEGVDGKEIILPSQTDAQAKIVFAPEYVFYSYLKKLGVTPEISLDSLIKVYVPGSDQTQKGSSRVSSSQEQRQRDINSNTIFLFEGGVGKFSDNVEEREINFNPTTVTSNTEESVEETEKIYEVEGLNFTVADNKSVDYYQKTEYAFDITDADSGVALVFKNSTDVDDYIQFIEGAQSKDLEEKTREFLFDLSVRELVDLTNRNQDAARFAIAILKDGQDAQRLTPAEQKQAEVFLNDYRETRRMCFLKMMLVNETFYKDSKISAIQLYDTSDENLAREPQFHATLTSKLGKTHPLLKLLEELIEQSKGKKVEFKDWLSNLDGHSLAEMNLLLATKSNSDQMKCSRNDEDCWEDLADWTEIYVHPERYVVGKKKPQPIRASQDEFKVTLYEGDFHIPATQSAIVSEDDFVEEIDPSDNRTVVTPEQMALLALRADGSLLREETDLNPFYQMWSPAVSQAFKRANQNGELDDLFLENYSITNAARKQVLSPQELAPNPFLIWCAEVGKEWHLDSFTDKETRRDQFSKLKKIDYQLVAGIGDIYNLYREPGPLPDELVPKDMAWILADITARKKAIYEEWKRQNP